MYVTDHRDRGLYVHDIAFFHQQLFCLGAYCFDHGVCQQLFLQGTPAEIERQVRELDAGRSILDVVSEQARELQRNVGARDRSHLAANLAVAAVTLSREDHAAIDAVLAEATPLPGEVYELERDRTGRHGAIMKYNLGDARPAA